jgi:hypothetical protein
MIYTCKHAKESRHAHHNVKVRHNKIGIVQMDIDGELPSQIPVNPPEMNILTNPIAYSIAGVNRTFPRQMVVIQLNTFYCDGNGDQ